MTEKNSNEKNPPAKRSARTARVASAQTEDSNQSVAQYVRQKLAAEQTDNARKPSAPVDKEAIRKQFKKKNAKIPSSSQVQRFSPDTAQGLTAAQVEERFSQFLFNDTNQRYSKSYASILSEIFAPSSTCCAFWRSSRCSIPRPPFHNISLSSYFRSTSVSASLSRSAQNARSTNFLF